MGLSAVADFFIALVVIAVILIVGWVAYIHWRAHRLGLPPPTFSSYSPFSRTQSPYTGTLPAHGGLIGWVNDKIRAFKNRNSRGTGGAYEEPLSSNVRGRGANRGFGPLDPDDAWDTRVGTEADAYGPAGLFEEQELGLRHGAESSYEGGGLTSQEAGSDYGEERGRSRSREPKFYSGGQARLNWEYDEGMGATGKRPVSNPFDDDQAEPSNVSLRGISPRPIDTSEPTKEGTPKSSEAAGSPTERRSIFREDM
jgi:hypothetical protein